MNERDGGRVEGRQWRVHDVSLPRKIKHIHQEYSLPLAAISQMAGKLALCWDVDSGVHINERQM